jgi:predicted lipoprotein with Yx(FWY)xxD motif
MTRSRPITFLASGAAIPLAALAVAGCGGSSPAKAAAPPPPQAAPTPAAIHRATVRVASSRLGRVLVDSAGRTLYLFKADSRTKSACSGACATAWPPLLVTGKPIAGTGLIASKLGTITRPGGRKQVSYNGHPLYLFIKDRKPGQTTGQGLTAFGAAWFVVSPVGNQVSSHPARHRGGSASSHSAAPATPPAANSQPAPTTTPQPAPPPAAKPAPPAAKPAPPPSGGIPQNGGGDDDSDNHGGPSDGDGNI